MPGSSYNTLFITIHGDTHFGNSLLFDWFTRLYVCMYVAHCVSPILDLNSLKENIIIEVNEKNVSF